MGAIGSASRRAKRLAETGFQTGGCYKHATEPYKCNYEGRGEKMREL